MLGNRWLSMFPRNPRETRKPRFLKKDGRAVGSRLGKVRRIFQFVSPGGNAPWSLLSIFLSSVCQNTADDIHWPGFGFIENVGEVFADDAQGQKLGAAQKQYHSHQ